jgi:hypothetical protein
VTVPRLMSVAFTEDAMRRRAKTVTRRKGWTFLVPGERITLCRKVMGRKAGEPLVRITDVRSLVTWHGRDQPRVRACAAGSAGSSVQSPVSVP